MGSEHILTANSSKLLMVHKGMKGKRNYAYFSIYSGLNNQEDINVGRLVMINKKAWMPHIMKQFYSLLKSMTRKHGSQPTMFSSEGMTVSLKEGTRSRKYCWRFHDHICYPWRLPPRSAAGTCEKMTSICSLAVSLLSALNLCWPWVLQHWLWLRSPSSSSLCTLAI